MTYSVRQLCERFQVHEQTVLSWINRGELKALNVGAEPAKKKPRWRVTQEALNEFEAGRTKATPVKAVKRRRTTSDAGTTKYFEG